MADDNPIVAPLAMPVRATLLEMDLSIPCFACGADKGEPCKGLENGVRHFARRLKWLLATVERRATGRLIITDEHGPS